MDLGLKGSRAIVTGGKRGIGRAIADTLAAEGAHVAICLGLHHRHQPVVDGAITGRVNF